MSDTSPCAGPFEPDPFELYVTARGNGLPIETPALWF
jgi:hypothetical protein